LVIMYLNEKKNKLIKPYWQRQQLSSNDLKSNKPFFKSNFYNINK
jgi:hypothetical protein